MKPSRFVRRWLRTRDTRSLRWGIPAILGIVAWLVFAICMAGWKPWQTETRYTRIAEKALAAKEFETARVASQRLLALGVEPRRKHLFDLALSLGGLGQDKEAVSLLGNIAPIDKPGYLHAHLFVAQTLLSKTNVTLQEIHTAEQHLKHVVTLDPRSVDANEAPRARVCSTRAMGAGREIFERSRVGQARDRSIAGGGLQGRGGYGRHAKLGGARGEVPPG